MAVKLVIRLEIESVLFLGQRVYSGAVSGAACIVLFTVSVCTVAHPMYPNFFEICVETDRQMD